MKEINRNVTDLNNKSFDKYGFALMQRQYIPVSQTSKHVFLTQNPNHVLYRNCTTGNICHDFPFVVFNIPQTAQEFEEEFVRLNGKNIVETMQILLKNHPTETAEILRAMPTCLFEDENATLQVLSCVRRVDDIIHKATDIVTEKMELLKDFREMRAQKNLSPDQQFDEMVKTYKQEKLFLDGQNPDGQGIVK